MRADDILDLARRVLRRLEGVDVFGLASMRLPACLSRSDCCLRMSSRFPTRCGGNFGRVVPLARVRTAREKGIPVIAELPDLLGQIENGEILLIAAVVVISPTEETRQTFEQRLESHRASSSRSKGDCRAPAITLDGQGVLVEANIGAHDDIEMVLENGASAFLESSSCTWRESFSPRRRSF